jgi:hypothetical protein
MPTVKEQTRIIKRVVQSKRHKTYYKYISSFRMVLNER